MIAEQKNRQRVAALAGVAVSIIAVATLLTPASAQGETVEMVELQGVIDPVTSRFLGRMIDKFSNEGSHAMVVRLDTPGGLDISMREMVQKVLNSDVPVIVWVAPRGARAASAGVFLSYASHVLVMAPSTNIGAAHPVNLGEQLDEVTSQKVTNDAVAYIRSIAEQRGRNADWAEKAVRESASLTASDAVEQNVADFVAGNPRTLLETLDGRQVETSGGLVTLKTEGASLRFHKMGLLERILHSVVRPEVAYLLLLLGFYGLIFELYHPGIGAAGVLGGVSLILGFYALSILPTSWAAVALIALGIAFFGVDLHTAGLGVFTIGGIVALLAGSILLFAGADPSLRLAWWAIAGAVGSAVTFFLFVMTAAIRARLARPVSGAEGLVDTIGVARSDIAPEGQVMARGAIWKARTAAAAISEGAKVKILGISGLLLHVEELKESEVQTETQTGGPNGSSG